MATIKAKPFDSDMQELLGEITTAYHAPELSKRDSSEIPEQIYMIEAEDAMAGYGVVWEYENGKQLIKKAEADYFSDDEKYLQKDFYIDIKNKRDFIFIEALDVLKEFESKGYAAAFINWLKAKYPNKRMYVYSLEKSRNFWLKQDFEMLGSTVWMTYN
ncbi:GCN5 family acetyltransferase [Paenibacillus sinopodophylli]|uniref:GCN5 family acetyltransferase n=1 Tax=Paenibacillus sinopodophylli TaxID=1837342 RepID=UPI00110CECF2|nr:GCN5 family acetyltransferase [Paenibacillus sinopodophylli]